MFWLGGSTPKSPLPPGDQGPHVTKFVVGPHKCTCQMACKYVERFKQGHESDRRQTDRPRYGEMCMNRRSRLRNKSDYA